MFRYSALYVIFFFVFSCSPNNVKKDNSLKRYFDQERVNGCFGMFDNGRGEFNIYNLERFRDSTYLPASTFKIVNSLIGIQTGRMNDENDTIRWDGMESSNANCNHNLSMKEAFKYSCVPWFRELARRIGRDTMQHWLDTLGYGRRYDAPVIKNNLDTFWLDNTVKVTADEQLGLVKKLYFDQLPFQNRAQRVVKTMMLRENNSNYKLSYKEGWGKMENGNSLGWMVGWIEENIHPYFFVLQIESADRNLDIPSARMQILKNILTHYGFMEGKK